MEGDDHEEEFYYTEVEIGMTSPTPTMSHLDMVRPPHEGEAFVPENAIVIWRNLPWLRAN